MIELKNISKTYANGVQALKNINLSVAKGEIFGVIGKSGAGKSSLLRCINLLEKPSSGEVMVAGQDLLTLSAAQLREARHHIGMIFQHFNLLSTKTVFDNVALPLVIKGLDKKIIKGKVGRLLEFVSLTDKTNTYPDELSGGQKQRVAIARALVDDPKVLLCDEATSALDPETTQDILKLVVNARNEFGLSVVLITHEMSVIKQIADYVALLHEGEIIEQRSIWEFFSHPQQALTKNFVTKSLQVSLPNHLQNKISATISENIILRLNFFGQLTAQPVISQCTRTLNIDFNILQANLDYLKNTPVGSMVLGLQCNQDLLAKVLQYFQQQDLTVEVLGYVNTNDLADT